MTTRGSAGWPDWIVHGGFLAALVGGAALRLWGLGRQSLWLDELVTLWAASAQLSTEVLSRCSSCMATPPLPFLVHHAFLSMLGQSEWSLRLPAALSGMLAIPVVFFAGRRMFGREAGVVSALFLAIHPLHLSASTDARPYAIAVLLAAGSVWAFSEAIRSGRLPVLIAWVLCSAGLLHAQFVFLPLLAAQVMAYVLLRRRAQAAAFPPAKLAIATGVIAFLCVALAPQIWSDAARSSKLVWPIQVEFLAGIGELFAPAPFAVAAVVALIVAFLGARGREFPSDDLGGDPLSAAGPDVVVVSLCCLVPALGLGALAWLAGMESLALPRYVTAYLAPAVLLVGWALTAPRRMLDRAVLSGSFLAILLMTQVVPTLSAGRSFNASLGAQDWRGAGRLLDAEVRDGDVVLLRSGLIESNGLFDGSYPRACSGYLGAPLPRLYVSRSIDPVILPATFAKNPPPAYDDLIGRRLAGHDRIWLVLLAPPDSTSYLQSVLAYIEASTGSHFTMVRSEVFGQVLVALVSPRSGS